MAKPARSPVVKPMLEVPSSCARARPHRPKSSRPFLPVESLPKLRQVSKTRASSAQTLSESTVDAEPALRADPSADHKSGAPRKQTDHDVDLASRRDVETAAGVPHRMCAHGRAAGQAPVTRSVAKLARHEHALEAQLPKLGASAFVCARARATTLRTSRC